MGLVLRKQRKYCGDAPLSGEDGEQKGSEEEIHHAVYNRSQPHKKQNRQKKTGGIVGFRHIAAEIKNGDHQYLTNGVHKTDDQ